MLNIFNQIANLASGTLAVIEAVSSVAPQVSAETQKQASLDLAGVALEEAARLVSAGTSNPWVALASALLPAIYDEVMTVVNKHGLIANSTTQTAAPAAGPAAVLVPVPAKAA
jgi:hypothetical protein